MFKINNWKEPIYKNDCINVIINGLISAILGGILGGLLDYLLNLINFPLSFSLIILCYFIGSRVKKGYYSYHILYPVLSILFFFIGLFFKSLTEYSLLLGGLSLFVITSPSLYLSMISPIWYLIIFISTLNPVYLFYTLFEAIIYTLCLRITFKLSKGYRN